MSRSKNPLRRQLEVLQREILRLDSYDRRVGLTHTGWLDRERLQYERDALLAAMHQEEE